MKNISQNESNESLIGRMQKILNDFKEMDFFQQCEKLRFLSELRESIIDIEIKNFFRQIEDIFYEVSKVRLGYGISEDKRPALQVF